jgi:hypothetical protein
MARKTGRVTKKRKRTTPRDLRSKTAAAVKGGASTYPDTPRSVWSDALDAAAGLVGH